MQQSAPLTYLSSGHSRFGAQHEITPPFHFMYPNASRQPLRARLRLNHRDIMSAVTFKYGDVTVAPKS